MTTEALALYEDVPRSLDCADTIYRRLQRVLDTGGSTECAASRLAHADQLFDTARVRAARTHGRASWDDRRAIERLIERTEVARERLTLTTQRAAKDLGWNNQDSLKKTLTLLVKTRGDRRRALKARLTVEKLELAYWPLVVIGLSGLAMSFLRTPDDFGVWLALRSLPATIGIGVAILSLLPVGARPRAVEVTLGATIVAAIVAFLLSFSGLI
ncbi:MAG: hypothetical protein JNM17_01985 [Archangium sp.]|nr:hypothetical protein [Archangium sp.]